jgi:hypothetical protein
VVALASPGVASADNSNNNTNNNDVTNIGDPSDVFAGSNENTNWPPAELSWPPEDITGQPAPAGAATRHIGRGEADRAGQCALVSSPTHALRGAENRRGLGVMMSAVAAALAIGRSGREGTAVGAMFSTMAVAAVARIALGAGHFAQSSPLTAALSWLPALSWLGAGLMMLPAVRRPALRIRTPFR